MNKSKTIFRQGAGLYAWKSTRGLRARVSNSVKRMRYHRYYSNDSVHILRDTERKVISLTTGPTLTPQYGADIGKVNNKNREKK